jgi:manganese transport protein
VHWKRAGGLFLGVLTAVGGFVDMGGIITAAQAGAQQRFALLWTVVPGLIGLTIYADMAGRVAIASGRTLFDVMRDRLGFRLALIPLVATLLVNTFTLVIELAGMALALQLAIGGAYWLWGPLMAALLALILWTLRFEVLENCSALLGLTMLVAVVAAVRLAPPWGEVATELLHPQIPSDRSLPAYFFLAISLLGAYMTPYQFYFYSSGAIEEEWDGRDLLVNRVTSILGSVFGALIVVALMVAAALVLHPEGTEVTTLAEAGRPIAQSLGGIGWGLFLLGAFAVSMGAGLETALSGAYAMCQYCGWDWGKRGRPHQAPLFHLGYLGMLLLAAALAASGLDPIQLTVVTLALAAASLPFTFLPLLIVANDRDYMGEQRNTLAVNVVAIVILLLLGAVTLAIFPLLVLTGGGA